MRDFTNLILINLKENNMKIDIKELATFSLLVAVTILVIVLLNQ